MNRSFRCSFRISRLLLALCLTTSSAVLLASAIVPAAVESLAVAPVISNGASNSTGSTCGGNGGNDTDSFCGNSVSVLTNDSTTFKSRFAQNVNADKSASGSARNRTGAAKHNVSFEVTATGDYAVVINTQFKGDLNVRADPSGTSASADVTAVTGTSNVTACGSLGIPDVGSLSSSGTQNIAFDRTGTAVIPATGNGTPVSYTLSFSWTASATSGYNEGAVRLGEQNGSTSSCSGCEYPGAPSRTQANDGHFVTITATSSPNLSVSKSAPSPALRAGQNSTYTITVSNTGVPTSTATVQDAIPAGMDLVSATGTNWSCTPASGSDPVGTMTCSFSGGSIGPCTPSTIDVVVKPKAGTEGTTVTNRVSVDPSGNAAPPDPTTCTGFNTPSAGCGAPVTSAISLCNSLATGNWNAPATWSCGEIPTAADIVNVQSGHNVTLNVNPSAASITVNSGGTLGISGNRALSSSLTVNGTLAFSTGVLDAGNNPVTIGCTGAVTGASATGFAVGAVKKDYCATGTFTYPVGTNTNGSEYSPVTAAVTAGSFAPSSSLSVKPTRGVRSGMEPSQSASRYWTLTETGSVTANLTFNYVNADVIGTEANYRLYRFNGTTPTRITATLNTTANTMAASGITDFSDWTIGTLLADLSNLTLSAGGLSPSFNAATTSYTVVALHATTSTTVTPTVAEPNSTVKVNGTSVASGTASNPISLAVGNNGPISVVVTASDGLSTKTYSVTVYRLNIIEDWRQLYFSMFANSGDAANTADPEGDGMINLHEFAFGTDPTVQQTNEVSYNGNVIVPGSPTTLVVRNTEYGVDYRALYSRRKDYLEAGLTYTVQFSADLSTWVDSTDTPTVVADNGTLQAVTVPYRYFINGKKARFFRVAVTLQ